MSKRHAAGALIPAAAALLVALAPAPALATASSSISPRGCTSGGGKVVRAPIGPITQPLYRCRGGTYNGRAVRAPEDHHQRPGGGGLLPPPR